MAIRPIEANGIIQRSQDVGQLKQNQDIKPQVEQQNIHHMQEKQLERTSRQIVKKENATDAGNTHHDAKEKGRGIFFDIRKKKEPKEYAEEEDGVVLPKQEQHFDMRI